MQANNIIGNVVLNKELEKYIESKESELLKKCEIVETKNKNLLAENAQLKARLSQYESTSPTAHTDTQQLLIKLNQGVISTINEIVVNINDNRSAWDGELSKYFQVYKKCKENLEKINLKVSNDVFEKKLREYKKVCDTNDNNRKDTLKQLYEIDTFAREKLEQDRLISSKYSKNVEMFVKEQNDQLDKIRELIFTYELSAERKLFEEALRVGKEGTNLFQTLLSSSNKMDSEEKVPSASTTTETTVKPQNHSDDNSIVAFDLPNSENLQEVLDFLNSIDNTLNLKEEQIQATKTFNGRTHKNLTKITLPSADAVRKIIREEKVKKVQFKGTSISLLPYKGSHITNK